MKRPQSKKPAIKVPVVKTRKVEEEKHTPQVKQVTAIYNVPTSEDRPKVLKKSITINPNSSLFKPTSSSI